MVAGGSGHGADPVAAAQRSRRRAATRPVRFFYGARTEQDLFYVDLSRSSGRGLPDFEFMPVVGSGFVHEAGGEYLESGEMERPRGLHVRPAADDRRDDRAGDRAPRHRREQQIFHDKFTTSADAVVGRVGRREAMELAQDHR